MDDLILQQRSEIIRTNNTAQETLEESVANLKPTITELTIKAPLYGNLDLVAALGDRFPQLKIIRFFTGKITEVRNIPMGITHFECPGNLLVDLDGAQLPGSLLVLNINDNFLDSLNLVGAPHLEELRCVNNRIVEFQNLPSTLKRFYCGQNQLRQLNLRGLSELSVLHCEQNPILRIKNLPANIHDFNTDNSPFALEIDAEEDSDDDGDEDVVGPEAKALSPEEKAERAKLVERKIQYIDAIQAYFAAKHKYDEDILKRRRLAYKRAPTKKMGRRAAEAVRPNCVYCNRPVGTRFYTNAKGHYAVCGDTTAPCALNVKLLRGSFMMKEYGLYMFRDHLETDKEVIIRHKLDTLFEYQSDEAAVRKFKGILENYIDISKAYEDYLIMYNELYFDSQKKEMIHKKSNKVNEILEEIRIMVADYRESENPATLKTAMELYVHDLIPEVENLRRLKYDVVEMEGDQLMEMPVSLQKLEQHGFLGEAKVVHFKGL